MKKVIMSINKLITLNLIKQVDRVDIVEVYQPVNPMKGYNRESGQYELIECIELIPGEGVWVWGLNNSEIYDDCDPDQLIKLEI